MNLIFAAVRTSIALMLSTVPVWAASASNKTVLVSMTVSVSAKADDGSFATLPRNIQRTIYISSKGRVFSRTARQAGRNSTTKELAPGEGGGGGGYRLQGNTLIGVLKFQSGAAQMVVNFDAGFQSCSVKVVFGREGGQAIRFKGLNGKMYTQQGAFNVSGESCSVREGNPFAD
jgi:hypothetical protein